MILDSLRLTNFGVYSGVQEAHLSPEPDGRNVILIGGMNGGGKTTFLDALQLCLYGKRARLSNRGKLAYSRYLASSIHRGSNPRDGASLCIRFRRVIDGETRHYELTRSWKETDNGIEETVRVLRDGAVDPVVTEHWDEVIEAYLPVSIAHLFFFDGEQIKDLAEGEHTATILGSAIRSLLGLDLVDRLEEDLKVLERRKKAEELDDAARRELEAVQEELADLDREMEVLSLQRGQVVNQAGRCAARVTEHEERFRNEGGDLFLQRKALEAQRDSLEKQKEETEGRLREIAAGALPLVLVCDLLAAAEEQARNEVQIRRSRVLAEVLADRDAEILARITREGIEARAMTTLDQILKADRSQRQTVAERPMILDAEDDLAPELRHLRTAILPRAVADAETELSRLGAIEEKLARVESELARVPDEDQIARFQKELDRARSDHSIQLALRDQLTLRIESLKRTREDLIRRLDRFGAREHEARQEDDDRLRILRHSEKVRATLSTFRSRVVARHVANLESLILECFRNLLRKEHLIRRLCIDPETFVITLFDHRDNAIPFERLSAGERQLLATSMLWGLARASGRPIPTIIDTPLGRLDSSHRRHLVERYFPNAAHQVLLLSTDEEIVGPYHQILEPSIARHYFLSHSGENNATTITSNYFSDYEAAS